MQSLTTRFSFITIQEHTRLKKGAKYLLAMLTAVSLMLFSRPSLPNDSIEYQVKAAFISNFIAFTAWPGDLSEGIQLCLYGEDMFGTSLDQIAQKPNNKGKIKVRRTNDESTLTECQVVFIAKSNISNLSNILNSLREKPILSLADSPNAASQGVNINMNVNSDGKVTFEINLATARLSKLDFSSKLLQLATHVYR